MAVSCALPHVFKQRLCRSAVCALSVAVVAWPLLPLSAQEQPAAPAESEAVQEAPAPEEELQPAEEAAEKEEVDPRAILREEQARRERIENLSRSQPDLPQQEGALLAGPNVPPGLLPGRGLRYGKVVFSPSATVGALITDNANSDDDDRESDVILGASATVRADALLRRHALGAQATATSGTSVEGSEDDFFNWQVGADGRYDLTRQQSLNAVASASLFQEADSSAAAEADDDATVNNLSGGTGYFFDGRLWDFSLNGRVDREEFDGDNTAERDNTTYTLSTRVVHRLSDRLSVFVSPEYAYTEFDDLGNEGQDRDSDQITGVVGADMQLRPRLSLGGSIGYSQTYFDDPDVEENGSVVGTLDARYAYDPRTTLALSVNRQVDVTTVDDAATETTTQATAQVTKLLAPRHALNTQAGYVNNEFDDGERTDHDITAAVSYFYRFDTNFVFNLGYQYFTRLSDQDEAEFDENQVFIGVTLAY